MKPSIARMALAILLPLLAAGCTPPPEMVAAATALAQKRQETAVPVETASAGVTTALPTSTLVAVTPKPADTASPAAATAAPAASATASPTASLAAPPVLDEPADGAGVSCAGVTLRWRWERALEADEYFDVRVWRLGEPHHGIAWTRDNAYEYRDLAPGNYEWSVAVIRQTGTADDGSKQWTPVSEESVIHAFGCGKSAAAEPATREPTSVPPTQAPPPTAAYP